MRIWIENPFDNLPAEGYRPQRYWLMARALVSAGHEVVYWTSDFSHANKAPRKLDPAFPSPPFRLELLSTRRYFRNISLRRVVSHLAYAREWWHRGIRLGASEAPDLIIASAPTIGSARTAIRLGRRFRARVVIDVQDAWPETFYRLLPSVCFLPFKLLMQRVYRQADRVSGVCERYRDLVRRADYRVAYLGIDPGERPQRVSRGFRLVYAGNIGRSYDLETVVEAVRRDERLTLDIAGPGDFVCYHPRVRFHGYLQSAGLRELFAHCDIGVIPMSGDTWVGLPNKLFDYTAADLAVVSSLAGETASLLSESGCGASYKPGDVDSLLAAIESAACVPVGEARRLCESRFDANRIYSDYARWVG